MKKEKKQAIFDKITNKAVAGQSESVLEDGGNLVDDIQVDILSPNFMDGSIYSDCIIGNITNAGIKLPRFNTSTQNNTGVWGANAYWLEEGEALTDSKIQFDSVNLRLNKLGVKIPVTEELAEDVDFLPTYINNVGGEAIKNKVDRGIVYGDNTTGLGGIVNTDDYATIYVTAGADHIATAKTMLGSYYGGSKATWVMSQDVWASIVTVTDASKVISYDGGQAFLFGYPIRVLPTASSGCLVLGDFSQYAIAQKELRKDISEHVLFSTDQSEVRIIARLQGAPIWSSILTIEDSSIVAPFVATSGMNVSPETLTVATFGVAVFNDTYTQSVTINGHYSYTNDSDSGITIYASNYGAESVWVMEDDGVATYITSQIEDVPYGIASWTSVLPASDPVGTVVLN